MKRIAALLLPLGLAACVVGPKYAPRTAADLRVPAAWKAALPEGAAGGDLSAWWNQLGDPLLTEFVEEAIQSSPTMDAARAKLRQARAQRRLTAAGLYPSVSASAGTNASKTGGQDSNTGYQAGFDASWEPDIFGAQRLAVRAAEADLASAAESLHDTQVSLAAEVALEYVTVRSLQARLAIARDNLAFQKETREIAGWRYQAGLVSGLDFEQAKTSEAQTRAQIPSLELSLAEARNRLAVLQGKAPGALDERLAADAPLPAMPAFVMVGIPADVLRQRPDIRSAERSVAAAIARLGQAVAARYPSLSLSGSLGVNGATLAALTGGASFVRSLAASVAKTIFDAGRIRRQIDIQSAAVDQSLAAYESAVLTAVEDAENALVSLRRNRERLAELRTADESARSAAELARQRYAAGLVNFLSVLTTAQSQLSASDSLKSCEADILTSLIQLYKALGGGWTAEAPESGAAAAEGRQR